MAAVTSGIDAIVPPPSLSPSIFSTPTLLLLLLLRFKVSGRSKSIENVSLPICAFLRN